MKKTCSLHAAFIRTPRFNPWTGDVDPEDSAFPHRDCTARAHGACYGPMAFRPLPDPEGLLMGDANNYLKIGFSFTPQLLAWLQSWRPETYRRILAADRDSAASLGRGNALAQPYVHVPLPRLSPQDRRTLLRWGWDDFTARFNRPPEGLWLPRLAADEDTLEDAVAAGFRFTFLPAASADRVRPVGHVAAAWQPVATASLDTTRPYRWLSRRHPGRELAIFFPHPELGAALACGDALHDGETLAHKFRAQQRSDTSTQLVHAAGEGEVYGLIHRPGPAVLSRALLLLEAYGLPPTNPAAFLDRFPPPQEVALKVLPQPPEPPWRSPLRAALHWLAGELDGAYIREAGALLHSPELARDEYMQRWGEATAQNCDRFLARRTRRHLSPAQSRQALLGLEMQRHRLLMLAEYDHDSADPLDPEPLQALRHAYRAVEIAAGAGWNGSEELRQRLAAIPSQRGRRTRKTSHPGTDVRDIWTRQIAPQAVDPERAAAHFAILEHLGVGCAGQASSRFSRSAASGQRHTRPLSGGRDATLSWLDLTVRDGDCCLDHEFSACVHQLDRLDLACWVLPRQAEPPALADALASDPEEGTRAELCRLFGPRFGTLDVLWNHERLQVMRWLMPDPAGTQARRDFLKAWMAAAAPALNRGEPAASDALLPLLDRCAEHGLRPDLLPWADLARDSARAALERFLSGASRPDLDRALQWMAAAQRTGLSLDMFELRCLTLLWQERLAAAAADPALRSAARVLAERLGLSSALIKETAAS
ncbi:MAG: DUF3536 domain-containing protein [Elusimicrobiota bacterium]|jgi:hypothetical protein